MFRSHQLTLVTVLAFVLALAISSDAQITFSRDWLAGSGKRAPSARVTFSRDWLAGSGKRSALPVNPQMEELDESAQHAAAYLLQYLNQYEDSVGRRQALFNYLQQHEKH